MAHTRPTLKALLRQGFDPDNPHRGEWIYSFASDLSGNPRYGWRRGAFSVIPLPHPTLAILRVHELDAGIASFVSAVDAMEGALAIENVVEDWSAAASFSKEQANEVGKACCERFRALGMIYGSPTCEDYGTMRVWIGLAAFDPVGLRC